MPKPFSMDLRERLISVVEGGMSRRSAAKFFSIAPSTAIKWVDQKRRFGSARPVLEAVTIALITLTHMLTRS